ncbi:MAG: SPOR domain-containing protein [Pseudomonadota bacterium]
MAEADFSSTGAERPATYAVGAGTFISVLGGVVSLALIAGICVWSYKLIARDVSGVPVVMALEGPMRVAPEDPGGRPADHQGLAVNEIAADGTASAPRDRLVLAPAAMDLTDEDAPIGEIAAVFTEEDTAEVSEASIEMTALAPADVTDVEELVASLAGPEAVEETIAGALAPLDSAGEGLEADDTAVVEIAAVPAVATLPDLGPGVRRSLRPQVRPVALDTSPVARPEAPAGIDVAASAIPAGTRLAQLGAFESPEVARAEWARLSDQFGPYLRGKKRVIQKATKAGRTFYRLRAHGFDDLADARRFCSALVAAKAACIPVLVE